MITDSFNRELPDPGKLDHVIQLSNKYPEVMYKAWAFPDLCPSQPQPRLENWPAEDLEAYCGGEYVRVAVELPLAA